MKVSFVLVVLSSAELLSLDFPQVAGGKYFEIIPDRFQAILETPELFQFNIKVRKVNNVRAFVGVIYSFMTCGNDLEMEMKALKKQGGEYRYMPYRSPPTPVCDLLTNDAYVYPDLAAGSDLPADIANHCPLSMGNYTLYNVTFNLENVPGITQIAQTGDYCVEIIYYLNSKHVATYQFYAFINNV